MKNRLYIQLGRVGDILNILPLCKRDFDATGVRPLIMVAEAFASVLQRVGYVEPIIRPGRFEDVAGAYRDAEKIAASRNVSVICTQIYGEKLTSTEECSSFMRESWARVPDAPAWGSLPLVFDRRDLEAEANMRELLLGRIGGKPYVVVALSGTSSPFEHAAALSAHLRGTLHGYAIVDVSGVVAPTIVDLLGVLEGARCIVTIDSAILHLAHAVPHVPVVAFITREPSKWHGSSWRPQQVGRFYYDEAPECFNDVSSAVVWARTPDARPRIYHAYTHLEIGASEDTLRRNALAARTWEPEYAAGRWVPMPFGDGHLRRSSGDSPICDEKPIPFMHDVINHACDAALDESDIIAWTNSDSCFVPGLTGHILDMVPRYGCAYTHRWDFHHKVREPLANEAQIRRGEWYPGTDAAFFTVKWWRQHRHEYPDMLVGREQNDEVLRQLIKARGGLEIPAAIYHEKHPSFWEHHGRRMNGHGNQYNHRLARRWFMKMGYRPFDPIWWQLEPEPAQRAWALAHLAQYGAAQILTR